VLLRRSFLIASSAWAAAIPLAAFAATRAAGSSATYAFALGMYAVGRLVCHQLPARSFHLWTMSLPVCARCTGIYFGAAIAAIALGVMRVRRDEAKMAGMGHVEPRYVLLAALAPTAATLIFEWTTGVTPSHWIRALAGAPLGAAVAWAIGMIN
jgi:hypothetical protein